MAHDPLDTVIGVTDSSRRDTAASAKHVAAAVKFDVAGDRTGAVAEYRKAVNADPANVDALFKLAYQLDLMGEEDEALALYEQCCDTPPANVNALLNLAVLYEDRCDFAAAERCLKQVLDTRPNHLRARLYMRDIQASREMVVVEEQDRDIFKRKAMLDTPVTDFELSVRARTCLKKMNIRTLGDLLKITEAELLSYKNFGETSLVEIKSMLTAKGLRLGQQLDRGHYDKIRTEMLEKLKGTVSEEVLNKPLSQLDCSVRARKALQLLGIHTLGDLAARTEAELMGVKNFGQTSLEELKQLLVANGLSLRVLD